MIRVVLDTNVIVSGILNAEGSPGQVLRAAFEEQQFRLVTSIPILGKIGNVLRRPQIVRRHGWREGEIAAFLARFFAVSLTVEGSSTLDVIAEDPSDNMFLVAAQEGAAEYLVSGDAHLQRLGSYQNILILPPRQFLDVLSGNP